MSDKDDSPPVPPEQACPAAAEAQATSAGPGSVLYSAQGVIWRPDATLLDALLDMTITYNAAVKALYATGNISVDAAMCWVCEHVDDEHLNNTPDIPGFSASLLVSEAMAAVLESYKMVIAVNTSLKMGTGKIVSQAGHAVLALYRSMLGMGGEVEQWTVLWEASGSKKIAVRAKDTPALEALQAKACELSLPSMLISDAGRTQVAPGSITTLAVFGPSSKVDQVTGDLKLL